jgi:peroxiredoxin
MLRPEGDRDCSHYRGRESKMRSTKRRGPKPATPTKKKEHFGVAWWLVPMTVVLSLFGLWAIFNNANATKNSATPSTYDVGRPGSGQEAPAFTLTANSGQKVSLSDYRGKNVLLYFQEGLTCPPCWDQMTVLEKDAKRLKAIGIEAVVSITTDNVGDITRKVSDMGLSTSVLSDPDMAISRQYEANRFGMMGESRNGHTFILVGPDGVIRWRGDYGGPPTYTMFVPVDRLLRDVEAGLKT